MSCKTWLKLANNSFKVWSTIQAHNGARAGNGAHGGTERREGLAAEPVPCQWQWGTTSAATSSPRSVPPHLTWHHHLLPRAVKSRSSLGHGAEGFHPAVRVPELFRASISHSQTEYIFIRQNYGGIHFSNWEKVKPTEVTASAAWWQNWTRAIRATLEEQSRGWPLFSMSQQHSNTKQRLWW